MRRVFLLFFMIATFLLLPLTAKESNSLISSSNSLLSSENSLISSENSLISSSNSLIDESARLISNENNLLSEENSLLSAENSLIAEEDGFISYGNSISSLQSSFVETMSDVNCVVSLSVEQETIVSSYLGDYDRFIAINLDGDSAEFAKYFAEWERNGAEGDFYSYVETEITISNLLENAKAKFGVGTAVILFDVALYFIPGGTLYKAIVLIPLKYAMSQAAIGTATGAVFGAVSATLQGKDSREVFAYALSGAADGYMVGAITGTLSGWGKAIKTYRGAYAISKDMIVLKNNDLVNLNGKKIGFVRDSVVYDLDGNISGIISSNGLYDDVARYSKGAWKNAAENLYIGIADDTVGNLPSVQQSLADYSYDGYYDINAIMDGYMDLSHYESLSSSYLSSLNSTIDDIMYATSNSSIPETISVWRGMTDAEYQALKEAGSFSKFLSTSVTGIPDDFIGNKVQMEIIVEKGTKGIYIGKYSYFRAENEMLLAPSNIEILSEEVKEGKTVVKAVIRALSD